MHKIFSVLSLATIRRKHYFYFILNRTRSHWELFDRPYTWHQSVITETPLWRHWTLIPAGRASHTALWHVHAVFPANYCHYQADSMLTPDWIQLYTVSQ